MPCRRHIVQTVYHPHRSVSYSAPYWKCIIDRRVHTKRKPAQPENAKLAFKSYKQYSED